MPVKEYVPHAKEFIPHANVSGPSRLEMPRADNSGVVNNDPMFVADRLAIINHVMAYSYVGRKKIRSTSSRFSRPWAPCTSKAT